MSEDYRERALSEHGEECKVCGAEGDIITHHRNGDRADNRVENLLPLCRSCHKSVHYGSDGFEELHSELPEHARVDHERTDRKRITVPESVFEKLIVHKSDDETWSEFLVRLHEMNTEAREGSVGEGVLTEAHIDDIASRTAKRVWENMPAEARSR